MNIWVWNLTWHSTSPFRTQESRLFSNQLWQNMIIFGSKLLKACLWGTILLWLPTRQFPQVVVHWHLNIDGIIPTFDISHIYIIYILFLLTIRDTGSLTMLIHSKLCFLSWIWSWEKRHLRFVLDRRDIFYRTRVRSLAMLVSNWLTDSLTHSLTPV